MFDFVSHSLMIKKLALYDISKAHVKLIRNELSGGSSEKGCQWRSITERGREVQVVSNIFLGLDSSFLNNLDMKN